ncbi:MULTISPECIES: hypothetical protein [unclassified Deinococcus]|uniref:hypothetical protein n=1 Tax=unclassified Deinococcus TaxID=2623546 RepID=UPI001C30EB29|nr:MULTISPECIES: hypothetical protein [unclassified Deinococcus]MDK2013568.1 hypothetical protein [Deinococcus sp. 43]
MSLAPDPELAALRAEAGREIQASAGLLFRHQLTFTLGEHTWEVRCSVTDPQRLKPDEQARWRAVATERRVPFADLRILKVRPQDRPPFPGAAALELDDGTLEVLEYGQVSDFTGIRVGTCVLRRP